MSENKFEDFIEGDRVEVVNYTAGDVERLSIMGMRGTVMEGTFGSTFLGLVAVLPDSGMPDELSDKAYFLFLPEEIEKVELVDGDS